MVTGLMESIRGKVLFHGSNIKDDLPGCKKVLGLADEVFAWEQFGTKDDKATWPIVSVLDSER